MQEKHLQLFYELKLLVLKKYQERFPYVELDWKKFSSKDIEQLIEDIQEKTKQKISEKWIYTHLKVAQNDKLPRKDMLDILTIYCGFESWNAYTFEPAIKSKKWGIYLLGFSLILILFLVFKLNLTKKKEEKSPILVKDYYSKELLPDTTVQVLVKQKDKNIALESISSEELTEKDELIVESPFYKDATLETVADEKVITVKPNDYALILKAFIKADLKDWETRKEKLDLILHEDLQVLIYLPDMLGIEYMNKEEFSQKLIVPTSAIKKWEIIHLTQDANEQITQIRIKQQ